MGIEAVNSNETILPNHHISHMLLNTGCEPDIVMLEFIKLIQATTREGKYTKLIGIVGPACSDTVQPIAGVSKNVYLQIFKKFNWRRAASLTEDGHQYSEYLTPLQDLFQDNGINFNMRKYPHGRKTMNMTQYLLDLKKQNYRIIIGEFYQEEARSVICEAYHQEMTGHQGYVWFVPWWYAKNWYDVDFWNQNDSIPVPCTTDEIIYALQGHMSLSYKYYGNDDSKTPANEYIWEWRKRYRENTEKFKFPESDYAGFTYDAVWTYALALHKLFQEDDAYTANLRSVNTTQRFIYYINNTNFDGVSGHINFTHGPSRLTDILIWQFTNKSYRHVGTFYPNAEDHHNGGRLDVKEKLAWPTGNLPSDGSEECIVEGLRVILGKDTSCSSAIIALCLTSFFSFGFVFVATILTLRRRYETRLRAIEAMWKNQSIFKKFEGWEIPRTKVVINRILGEGQFGTVYGGECLDDELGWVAVAVKTLKDGSTSAEKLDFLSEAEMMKNFDHENIVKLLGVCTDGEPIYTVMEFMLYGDLKTYLLARRHLVNEKNRNDDDEVSNHRLTSMALDVAKALAYLSRMKYVHRDIACRNCLVNTIRSVKLADFGMTRPLNEKNYYRFSRKGMLPVRWMAPESLTEGVFTTNSDIWSYGVLLYEVITFGAFPFQGLNNNQVFEKVKSGQTLPIPSGILPGLECLLQACWHPVPSKRLTAEQIVMHLENSPRLVSPSLEGPHASLPIEDAAGLELRIPDKTRKLSLSLNSRAMLAQSMGVGGGTSMGAGMSMGCGQGVQGTANGRRKRSMSGNMMVTIPSLTASLSEDGTIPSYNLEALNLNQVMIEEVGERDMGEDPLLPPSQYISSRIMSLSHRDIERGISGISKDKWTSITPV
ncbi:Tyrosine-protein kinase transforming protein ros [Armadillidium nasatum]|uniref:receptor protein-tyrosine kinase n=1 Tax=Armadillidium nasatum TaxID=96803 RepID=A0A5N5SN48_9CRUS|nr:Tyrosine-protein kinase transforming protein ros [Armadillidium nasatum]